MSRVCVFKLKPNILLYIFFLLFFYFELLLQINILISKILQVYLFFTFSYVTFDNRQQNKLHPELAMKLI